MQTAVAPQSISVSSELQEKVLLGGDLARLTSAERLNYYSAVCASVGLNPLTRPFEYLILNNKMVLYARKDCTDQLRDLHGISVEIVGREMIEGIYVVTARAKNMMERTDESIGAVPLPTAPLDKANAIMKAETKAKRRVTLSICGLGMLDETEVETVPVAKIVHDVPSKKPSEVMAEIEAREAAQRQEDGLAKGRALEELEQPNQSIQDAPTPLLSDPAEPYRVKLRTCARDAQTLTHCYNAVPEALRQDVFSEYQMQLKSLKIK